MQHIFNVESLIPHFFCAYDIAIHYITYIHTHLHIYIIYLIDTRTTNFARSMSHGLIKDDSNKTTAYPVGYIQAENQHTNDVAA